LDHRERDHLGLLILLLLIGSLLIDKLELYSRRSPYF